MAHVIITFDHIFLSLEMIDNSETVGILDYLKTTKRHQNCYYGL